MTITVTADTMSAVIEMLGLNVPKTDIMVVWDRDYNRGYDEVVYLRSGTVTVFNEQHKFENSERLADILNENLLKLDIALDLRETKLAEERSEYAAALAKEQELKALRERHKAELEAHTKSGS